MFKALLVVSTCLLASVLAACGSSGSSSSSSSSSSTHTVTTLTQPSTTTSSSSAPAAASAGSHSTLAVAADPQGQLKFNTTSLSASAGKVTIAFANAAPLQHNLTIQQGTNGTILGSTPTFAGGTKTIVTNLTPGTYAFYCSVPGHRGAGMQGTLTVH